MLTQWVTGLFCLLPPQVRAAPGPRSSLRHLLPGALACSQCLRGQCLSTLLAAAPADQPDARTCAQRLGRCPVSPLLPSCSSRIVPSCCSGLAWPLRTCPRLLTLLREGEAAQQSVEN